MKIAVAAIVLFAVVGISSVRADVTAADCATETTCAACNDVKDATGAKLCSFCADTGKCIKKDEEALCVTEGKSAVETVCATAATCDAVKGAADPCPIGCKKCNDSRSVCVLRNEACTPSDGKDSTSQSASSAAIDDCAKKGCNDCMTDGKCKFCGATGKCIEASKAQQCTFSDTTTGVQTTCAAYDKCTAGAVQTDCDACIKEADCGYCDAITGSSTDVGKCVLKKANCYEKSKGVADNTGTCPVGNRVNKFPAVATVVGGAVSVMGLGNSAWN